MARIIFTLEDGTEIETELDADTITIGRHPDCNVVLPSVSVSGQHATIKHRGDGYFVQDLGTTNGTKLNGVDVEEARLEHGDRLFFGDVPAVVQLMEKPARPETPAKSVSYPASNMRDTGSVLPAAVPAAGIQRRVAPRHSTYVPRSSASSGCAGFMALLIFLLFAFIAGLCIRHAVEHGGFLIVDLVKKYTEKGDQSAAKPGSDKDKEKGKDKKEAPKNSAAPENKPSEPAKPEGAAADKGAINNN
jgi:pSer/pThr/pTyr-binding forkhead associated (FHA) protein